MEKWTLHQKQLASKQLSKLKLDFSDELMNLTTHWCRIAYKESAKDMMHHHSFYELHYILSGYCDFTFQNDKRIRLQKGQILVIPPKCVHCILDRAYDTERFVFAFSLTFNSEHPDAPYLEESLNLPSATVYKENHTMRYVIEKLPFYAHNLMPTSIASIGYALRLFISELLTAINPTSSFNASDKKNKYLQHQEFVEKIRVFILNNIEKGVTGNYVANQFNISIQQLNRILLQEIGMTVSQMITDTRTRLIRTLLENSNLPLKTIAIRTGFSNEYNMSRFFKREEGMSPGIYRKSIYKKD